MNNNLYGINWYYWEVSENFQFYKVNLLEEIKIFAVQNNNIGELLFCGSK